MRDFVLVLASIGLTAVMWGVYGPVMRTAGKAMKPDEFNHYSHLLPFVWVGFIINATTGSLLFIYGATGFGTNKAFYLKMTFMVIAGLNALAFDLAVRRATLDWVSADRPPPYVKVFATLSFALWLCVVTTGRWMAYR